MACVCSMLLNDGATKTRAGRAPAGTARGNQRHTTAGNPRCRHSCPWMGAKGATHVARGRAAQRRGVDTHAVMGTRTATRRQPQCWPASLVLLLLFLCRPREAWGAACSPLYILRRFSIGWAVTTLTLASSNNLQYEKSQPSQTPHRRRKWGTKARWRLRLNQCLAPCCCCCCCCSRCQCSLPARPAAAAAE